MQRLFPDIKVVLTSGYAEDILQERLEENEQIEFSRNLLHLARFLGEYERFWTEKGHPLVSYNVLVVDDEEAMRRLLRNHLESCGHSVAEANDGNQAIKRLQEEDVDIVIADILMPDMDGLELLIHIKKQFRQVPVIVITGKANTLHADNAHGLGAAHVITKPFKLDAISAAVDGVIAI